jgi:poly(A) polymerase
LKLKALLGLIEQIAAKNKIAKPYIAGGAPRDKVLGTLKNLDDIDLTNGEKSISNLAKETEISLSKQFSVEAKQMEDGHTSLFLGTGDNALKIDFSSNFMAPNISEELSKNGIHNSTDLIKEAYSRDFFCNTLLMDFDMKTIKDPTKQGIKDIKAKILRTCLSPDITFRSNHNRIIRTIYLAAKLNFSVDPQIIEWIKTHKEIIKTINTSYLTKTLNKAIQYNKAKTIQLLDQMELWQEIPITEPLYQEYANRFVKSAQLKRNFDYGEGFYANLDKVKSVSDYRRKRSKKRKKILQKIRDMKFK